MKFFSLGTFLRVNDDVSNNLLAFMVTLLSFPFRTLLFPVLVAPTESERHNSSINKILFQQKLQN